MRSLILTLSLAVALPLIPSMATADSHSCDQLRQTVFNRAPARAHNLPYGALQCSAISELHLLLIRRGSYSDFELTQQIEALFRREGLIR